MSRKAPVQRWKQALFAIVAIGLFFAALEVGLGLLGVQPLLDDRDPFQGFSREVQVFELDTSGESYRTPRRAVLHSFNYQEFASVKSDGSIRLFVVGGSSAFGFPWGAEVAFPHWVGVALEGEFPDREIEAINAGAMSYGSTRLRILVSELLAYEPDVIVIYGGHNEFVERYFYKNLLGRHSELDRLQRNLSRSRIYSSMARGYERFGSSSSSNPEDPETPPDVGLLLGLDVERDSAIDVGGSERERVRQHFEANLRAIAEETQQAGVPLIFCTVPSNVTGWVPNQSIFDSETSLDDRAEVLRHLADAAQALEQGRAADALTMLDQALKYAPEYAETSYRIGEVQVVLEQWAEARNAFVNARDLDGQPARAPSSFNETIRTIAADQQIPLVDVERLFERVSPNGLLGFNLFEDYVHPNILGHRWIAFAVWQKLHELGLAGSPASVELDNFVVAAGIDPRDPVDDAAAAALAASAGRGPDLMYNLAVVLENRGLTQEAIEKYQACLRLRPQYHIARENMAHLLFKLGQFGDAAREYAEVLETRPRRAKSLIGLGESLRRTGNLHEAMGALLLATEVAPESVDAWNSLGGAWVQAGQQSDAEAAFQHALELEPDSIATLVNLGLTRLFQGHIDEAETVFRSALELEPQNLRARGGLAAVLTERGELDEAERMFKQNLALNPDDEFALGGLRLIDERRVGASGPGS